MTRNWTEFDAGPAQTARDEIYVSMNRRGEIILNRLAVEQLGHPEAVVLLFDEETDTIGLKPSTRLFANAYPLKLKGQCGHRVVRGWPFVSRYKLQIDGTVRFRTANVEDGVLILELRSRAPVNRGRWKSTGRR